MITKTIKKDFPVFDRKINNNPLVYLDNSATTQIPTKVINDWVDYYSFHKANVHRGVHKLSEESTDMYENSRLQVAKFLNISKNEVIFVKNATEGANLVAFSFIPKVLKKGDTIMLSEYEHHSNILPWTEIAKVLKLNIKIIPFTEDFKVDFDKLRKESFNFLAINHVSNFLGNVNDIKKVCEICNSKKAYSFIDGAQGISHLPTNLTNIGCDFYTFSGHKIYAPFGTGALFVKEDLLLKMGEFMYGGGMITQVSLSKASYVSGVEKYDAGTPNVGAAVSLASALKYFESKDKSEIFKHEEDVLGYLYEQLKSIKGIEVYGPPLSSRAGLVSFNLKGIHSHDVASVLDNYGIAVRSGNHCTMPAHKKLNVTASVRASIGIYNFKEDVDILVNAIGSAKKIFK